MASHCAIPGSKNSTFRKHLSLSHNFKTLTLHVVDISYLYAVIQHINLYNEGILQTYYETIN